MKTTMQIIFASTALFLGLSTAAPTLEARTCDCAATGINTSANPILPDPPALPHRIQNGDHFINVLNYTSPTISINSLLPCLLQLDQTAIAHVSGISPGSLTDNLYPPHGFECTKNDVNLLINYSKTIRFTDLNELTSLFQQWLALYSFRGIHFEYGIGNQVYTTGDFSTQKKGDSG